MGKEYEKADHRETNGHKEIKRCFISLVIKLIEIKLQ